MLDLDAGGNSQGGFGHPQVSNTGNATARPNGAHGMHVQGEGKDEYLYFCDEKHGVVTRAETTG